MKPLKKEKETGNEETFCEKGAACMACLECVQACSRAFYKEFHPDKSCIQIVEKTARQSP